MRLLILAAAAATLLAAPARAQLDCEQVQDDYQRALDELGDTLRQYAKCVGESGGNDDCSIQFKQLEKAHRSFDRAVLDIRTQCNPNKRGKFGD